LPVGQNRQTDRHLWQRRERSLECLKDRRSLQAAPSNVATATSPHSTSPTDTIFDTPSTLKSSTKLNTGPAISANLHDQVPVAKPHPSQQIYTAMPAIHEQRSLQN